MGTPVAGEVVFRERASYTMSEKETKEPIFIPPPPKHTTKWEAVRNAIKKASIEHLGKIAGALAAIVALITLFFPSLLPWTTYKTAISQTDIEYNVPGEEYDQRAYALDPEQERASGLPQGLIEEINTVVDEPEWPYYEPLMSGNDNDILGNVVSYNIQIEGFQERPLLITWSLYKDPATRVSDNGSATGPLATGIPALPVPAVEAERRNDNLHGDIFVPLPKASGTYFVKIEAWDPKQPTWGCSLLGWWTQDWCHIDKANQIRMASASTTKFDVGANQQSQLSGNQEKPENTPGAGLLTMFENAREAGPRTKSEGAQREAAPRTKSEGAQGAGLRTLPETGGESGALFG